MKEYILFSLFILISIQAFSQTKEKEKRKFRFPVWITHSQNTDISGLSLGFFPNDFEKKFKTTKTFGIRIEAFLLSPFYFLAPRSPISRNESSYLSKMETDRVSQKYLD